MLDLLLLNGVLRVPHIMSDEFLNTRLPILFEICLVDILNLMDQPIHILNQDVIARDQHSFLVFDAVATY